MHSTCQNSGVAAIDGANHVLVLPDVLVLLGRNRCLNSTTAMIRHISRSIFGNWYKLVLYSGVGGSRVPSCYDKILVTSEENLRSTV